MLKKVPHTYVIIFYIIIICAGLTWVIPGGEYDKQIININGSEKEVIVEGSFHYVENVPQTWHVFSALFKGFERQADIIVFILLIGGAFWIMNSSKALDVGILSFLRITKKIEKVKFLRYLGVNNIIITLIMIMFSLFGAVFGMSEETIAFIIIFVPLSISMGYDSIVGVSMCFVAAGLGFAGAMLNPFTIGIAQGIAELEPFSGIEYRFFAWIVINFIGIFYVLRYARKIKKTPEASPVYNEDKYWREKADANSETLTRTKNKSSWVAYIMLLAGLTYYAVAFPLSEFNVGGSVSAPMPIVPIAAGLFAVFGFITVRKSAQMFVLNLLMFTIIYLIIGVLGYGWYIMEIATLFFVMGIFSGIAMGYTPDKITKLFLDGVKDILSAAMVVGLAAGIIVILEDGKIINTILHNVSEGMSGMGKMASVGIMYAIQTVINVIIPSGSAKAAITMPIMAPFSDLIGVSRQATVVAFQFGDGFTNMITPTSGVLIAVLGVAKIPYEKWVKWITPFMVILILLGLLLLIPTVTMNLNGF